MYSIYVNHFAYIPTILLTKPVLRISWNGWENVNKQSQFCLTLTLPILHNFKELISPRHCKKSLATIVKDPHNDRSFKAGFSHYWRAWTESARDATCIM